MTPEEWWEGMRRGSEEERRQRTQKEADALKWLRERAENRVFGKRVIAEAMRPLPGDQ